MSCSADTKVAGRSLRHDVVPHVAAHNTHQERLKISLVAPTRLFNNIGQTAKNSTGANLFCYTALSWISAKRLDTSQKGDIGTFGWRQQRKCFRQRFPLVADADNSSGF
jgi:hypothetical protein